MEVLSSADCLLLKTCALAASSYAAKSLISNLVTPKYEKPDLPLLAAATTVKAPTRQPTRSILKQLQQNNKSCMILYGSQTGTAERFAHRFAREALQKYNLGCIVGDLDDYDYDDILTCSKKQHIVFMLATYGEGEPTDNAITFENFMNSKVSSAKLEALHYSAFGLGSSSYAHYNAMISRLDQRLTVSGAQKMGRVGLGDDGKGTLEEDFLSWTNETLPLIAAQFDLSEIPYVYKPAFQVVETVPVGREFSNHTFLGEPNKAHLYGRIQGPFTAQNPFSATIASSRELITTADRNCLHMEFDVAGTSISYDTGDHLAVWPENSDHQVNLFLNIFNLSSKRDHTIEIIPLDPNNKLPIPAKTTYETVARYYLDICTTVTRQMVRKLSEFTTSDLLQTALVQLADDKAEFDAFVTTKRLTISQLVTRLCTSSNTTAGIDAPFSLILELIPKLRPRHYSISSSSLVSRTLISITAVVDSKEDAAQDISFRGVSTSYLSALKTLQEGAPSPTHTLRTHRQSEQIPKALIHVRRSKFRPPFNPAVPIIMIGPGTGVAPFHAFIHERAHQYSQGRVIGRTVLFYGCRDSSQDFLYQNEWEDLTNGEKLGKGVFSIYSAFSRQKGCARQYVQDLIVQDERAQEIRQLVLTQHARVYICGNASRMAKDVTEAMANVLSNGKDGGDQIAQLRREGRWFEDVW